MPGLRLLKEIRQLIQFQIRFNPRGKRAFISNIPFAGRVLDVGCGNNSPFHLKSQRPDVYYTGIDIADYKQDEGFRLYTDDYILVTPDKFTATIKAVGHQFDAVISSHNIEHCFHPEETLRAMARSLKKGGNLFMAFPCEESVDFPSRRGTLNFYDDPTHINLPSYSRIKEILQSEGLKIEYSIKRNRPPIYFLIGLFLEPFGHLLKRNMPLSSTWTLYGFESIIWASRP